MVVVTEPWQESHPLICSLLYKTLKSKAKQYKKQ